MCRFLAIFGQTWWRIPERQGKTTNFRWVTTSLPHALAQLQTLTTEVTSQCVDYYLIQGPVVQNFNSLTSLLRPQLIKCRLHNQIQLFLVDKMFYQLKMCVSSVPFQAILGPKFGPIPNGKTPPFFPIDPEKFPIKNSKKIRT